MRKVPWNSLSFIAGIGIAVAIARAQSYPEGFWGFILTDPYLLPLLALLAVCLLLYGLSGVEFVRKLMWRLFAFLVPPPEHAAKGRLKIHTALLGNGPNNDRNVRDRLQQLCSNSSLDVVISYQLLIGTDPAKDDPAPGEDKRLLVEYSFASGPIFTTERPQSTRLILPEDPWMLRRIGHCESSSTELRADKTKRTLEMADLTATVKGEQQENQRLREVLQKNVDYGNRQAAKLAELSRQIATLSEEREKHQAIQRSMEFIRRGMRALRKHGAPASFLVRPFDRNVWAGDKRADGTWFEDAIAWHESFSATELAQNHSEILKSCDFDDLIAEIDKFQRVQVGLDAPVQFPANYPLVGISGFSVRDGKNGVLVYNWGRSSAKAVRILPFNIGRFHFSSLALDMLLPGEDNKTFVELKAEEFKGDSSSITWHDGFPTLDAVIEYSRCSEHGLLPYSVFVEYADLQGQRLCAQHDVRIENLTQMVFTRQITVLKPSS